MGRISIKTQGCSNNLRESEIMGGILDKEGHSVSLENNGCDIEIINICTVKGDNTALKEIRKSKERNNDKKIIVAGCITESIIPKIREIDNSINFVNTHNIEKISEVVKITSNNGSVQLLEKKYVPKVNIPSVRKNPVVGIVPILNSCNYLCTFCSTKQIKGKLMSYPMDDIKQDVKNHLKAGCKEIWITSQDTGAYMIDQGGKIKLIELLESVLSVPVDYKLRLGMMNPGNTINVLDKLIEVYKHEKMFKFIHIPVQSGNDEVLRKMNRRYPVETFYEIVNKFREEIPEINISTDIIVGFPSETEDQFNDTMELVKKVKPDVLNRAGYAIREGTIAAKMDQVPGDVIKQRTRKLTFEFKRIVEMNNKKWLGWNGKVLIDEVNKDGSFVARNYCYKPVILKGNYKLGDEVEVEIVRTTTFALIGEEVK